MSLGRALEIWPLEAAKGARYWVGQNVKQGNLTGLTGAVRLATGQAPTVSMNFLFDEATIKALHFLPPITEAAGYATVDGQAFTLVAEAGKVTAPQGGDVEIKGTVFRIADINADLERAEVMLKTQSPVTAALSLLNQAPLSIMDKAKLGVDIADGRAFGRALLEFDLLDDLEFEDVAYQVEGEIRNLNSTKLIEEKTLTANLVSFRANEDGIAISGAAAVDGLPVNGTWSQDFGEESAGKSKVEGTIEISENFGATPSTKSSEI